MAKKSRSASVAPETRPTALVATRQGVPSRIREALLAGLLYLAVSLVFFAGPLALGQLIAHGDGILYYYPLRAVFGNPLTLFGPDWNTYNFLGYPLSGTMQTGIYYPLNLLYAVLSPVVAYNASVVLHYGLAGWLMYLLCRELRCSPQASFLAGLAFAFGGFLQAHRGHVSMMNSAAWLPGLILCAERFRHSRQFQWLLAEAFVLAMQFSAGYAAVLVYSAISVAVYLLLTEWSESRSPWGAFRLLAWQGVVAPLTALALLPQLWAAARSLDTAYRSGFDASFVAAGSWPAWALPTLLFPFAWGGGFGLPLLGGYDVVEFGAYCGVLTAWAATLVVLRARERDVQARVWGVIAVLSLVIMLCRFSPLGAVLVRLPGLSLFRYHARMLLVLDMALSVLLALATDRWLLSARGLQGLGGRALIGLAGVMCLIAMTLASVPASLVQQHVFDLVGTGGYLSPAGQEWTRAVWRSSSPALVVPLLVAAGLIGVLALLRRWPVSRNASAAALGVLLLADLYMFAMRYDVNWPAARAVRTGLAWGTYSPRSTLVDRLLASPPWERHVDLKGMLYQADAGFVGGSLNLLDGRSTLGGHEPLLPANMRALFGMLQNGISLTPERLLRDNVLLSLAAVRHVIVDDRHLPQPGYVQRPGSAAGVNVAPVALRPVTRSLGSGASINLAAHPEGLGRVGDLWEAAVDLEPDSRYLVTFYARTLPGPARPPGNGHALVVDFYGGPERDAFFSDLGLLSTDLAGEERLFQGVLDSYPTAMPGDRFRVYNAGGAAVALRDLRVLRLTRRSPSSSGSSAAWPYRRVTVLDGVALVENANARGRVHCIADIQASTSPQDAFRRLQSWDIDILASSLVSPDDRSELLARAGGERLGCGQLEMQRFTSGDVRVRVSSSRPQFVVFSEQWDPEWCAQVDGREERVMQADLFAQGIFVPAGSHEVRFVHRPTTQRLLLAGPLAFGVLCLHVLRRGRRRGQARAA